MTSVLPVDEFAVADLIVEVFAGLLGEDCEPPFPAGPSSSVLPVVGYLAIRGGWHSEVIVRSSRSAAQTMAEKLFLLPAEAVSDTDLRDVIGELTNVIGGNLKSLMPGPSALSLPQTALDGTVEGVYSAEALRLDLNWAAEPLQLLILEPTPTY